MVHSHHGGENIWKAAAVSECLVKVVHLISNLISIHVKGNER